MKFKYHAVESQLFDIMQTPRLLFSEKDMNEDDASDFKDTTLLNQIEDPTYKQTIKEAQTYLQPYQQTISKFYADEFMSAYDLFLILAYVYPLIGHTSLKSYFESILAQDTHTLKQHLITSILATEKTSEDIDDQALRTQAISLLKHHEDLMNMIKDISTDEQYKWQLLLLIENPKQQIQTFYGLLNDIKPLYDSLFKPLEADAKTLAESFENPTPTPQSFFESMTNNLVSADILPATDIPLFISLVFPYAFMQKEDLSGRFLMWGLNMQEGFKLIAKQKENQAQERIQVFKLLSDKTRYEVLKLIASGITSTKTIADKLDVSSATISYHINAFFTSNIIRFAKEKKVKYEVNFDRLDALWDTFKQDLK